MRSARPLFLLLALTGCPVPAPFHALVLADRSDSVEDGHGSSCPAVAGLLERALRDGRVDGRATVAVWATPNPGDAPSALLPDGPIPYSDGLEGREKGEEDREKALDAFAVACPGKIGQRRTSPLVDTVRLGVEHLRAVGCQAPEPGVVGPSACALLVVSDFEETEDRRVMDAVRARAKVLTSNPTAAVPSFELATVDARGIEIYVCGTGHGRLAGVSGSALQQATKEVWRALLPGAEPTFDGVCPVYVPDTSPNVGQSGVSNQLATTPR